MGRRRDLQNREQPTEEGLLEVISGSGIKGIGFADLVRQAKKKDISKATVARHLSGLIERGLVKKEQLESGRARYRLAMGAIREKHVQRSLFSALSMHLFDEIFEGASTGKLTDGEFTRLFTKRIGVLAMYALLTGLGMARKDPDEAGKWIEEAFGTLIQKDGWRMCLNRQIFGGPVTLRRPISMKTPVVPEILVEEGAIYVKLPESVEPGLASRVLKAMPPIPENRLRGLEASLEKLYPEEAEILHKTLSLIQEAANLNEGR